MDDFHKKKRNEKLFGARSEGEIKQQLAEIERAAKEAVAADKLEATGLFYQVILLDYLRLQCLEAFKEVPA